jgi:hypothetical protein
MIASVGSSIRGSGTSVTWTFSLPCHVSALMTTPWVLGQVGGLAGRGQPPAKITPAVMHRPTRHRASHRFPCRGTQ